MVEHAEVPDPRHLAQLDADDVARMAPVGLDRDGVGQRIHRVEDDDVGVAEEAHEALGVLGLGQRMLGIGRVDDDALRSLEPEAVGVAAMALPQ